MEIAASKKIDPPSLFGVESSLTGQRWIARLDQTGENTAKVIQQRTGLSDIVARVIAGRGVDPDDVAGYLDPALKRDLPDPGTMADMDVAAARIAQAIREKQSIAIFGDYDVDGACSAALVSRYLTAFHCPSRIYIPDRIIEGYGPNPQAIGELADGGADLIVCVDCGSTSHDAAAAARKRHTDLVVLDHHQVGVDLPDVAALVNPNRQDDLSGLGYLAAVGVTFLTLVAVSRELRRAGFNPPDGRMPDLLAELDLVALGTVCDVVPLVGVNRALVKKGLIALRHHTRPGIAALMESARLRGPVESWHLGFMLGPRINAGGRIGDAGLGAKLLTRDSEAEAHAIADTLGRLNDERQVMEQAAVEAALGEVAGQDGEAAPAVCLVGRDDWHPGIVGLVASRLKDRLHRPAFAIAFAGETGTASGRSIAGVDIGAAVRKAVEAGLVLKGGGHAMAAGLTVGRDRVADLQRFFNAELGAMVAERLTRRALSIDAPLTAPGADLELLDTLDAAGPYGAGNPRPVFAFPAHRITSVGIVGRGHVRANVASDRGGSLKAMAFRSADTPLGAALMAARGGVLHVAGTLSVDRWGGTPKPQLTITDAALPG